MKCCFSCVYWEKASRKIPVNAKRKMSEKEFISIEFKGRVVKVPSWEWVPTDPSIMNKLGLYRLCFYGKGLIMPWDLCDNYVSRFEGNKAACDVSSECEYDKICPKFKFKLKYIA